jgi:hypothetical protein
MGRKLRSDSVTELVAVRLSAAEVIQLKGLQVTQGHSSMSETMRWALGVAAGTVTKMVTVSGLVNRLNDRLSRLVDEPLADEELILRVEELKGQKKKDVEEHLFAALERLILYHVDLYGWFYPPCASSAVETLEQIHAGRIVGPRYSGMGRCGLDFMNSRIRAFWETRKGPVESLYDANRRKSVLRHLLGLSTAKKPWDISLMSLRRGFLYQFYAVSVFRPAVAAGVYRKWLGDVDAPVVWDPSAGFGARMLGFFAEYPNGSYYAHEPASATYRDLSRLAEDMPGTVHLQKQGSEFADWQPDMFDLVFTSPPYFDVEKYFDEEGQVWVEYPDVVTWRDKQVFPTLAQAAKAIKPGGFVVININELYRATYIIEAQKAGLRFYDEEHLVLQRSHFARSGTNKKVSKTEPILVFRKD